MEYERCKHPLVPPGARRGGEETTVGFWPFPCSKYDWTTFSYVPQTEEDLERERLTEGDNG